MRAVDLYILTRSVPDELIGKYEKELSGRRNEITVRSSEVEMIRRIIGKRPDEIQMNSIFSNWFYSFSIPHISKEFDLLKVDSNNGVSVNIELKSDVVGQDRILKQLIQNAHYLKCITNEVHNFCFLKDSSGKEYLYYLENESLKEVTFDFCFSMIEKIINPVSENIELLFKPGDYLISPLNNSDKFLSSTYFLTDQQEEVKREILNGIYQVNYYWGLKGAAGTGKTLLLYDIALELAKEKTVCIIHCGKLNAGHYIISKRVDNIKIISAKDIEKKAINDYDYLLIDEAHRIYKESFDYIIDMVKARECEACIFSYDIDQALSNREQNRDIPCELEKIEGFRKMTLSKRIRINKDLASFTHMLLHSQDKMPQDVNFEKIDVFYACDNCEASIIINIMKRQGYEFITYTPSQYCSNSIDFFGGEKTSHDVIGQEFDKVVIMMDSNFRYGEGGELEGRIHPNPDYLFPKLFYQNITRAREYLAIVVVSNKKLFDVILDIKMRV